KDRRRVWRTHLPSESLPKSLLPDEPTDALTRKEERSNSPDGSVAQPPFSRDAERSAYGEKRQEKPPATFNAPLDQQLVQQVLSQHRPRRRLTSGPERRLETHWYECLLYPFRAWSLVFGLASAFALCIAVLAVVMSREDR